MLLIPNAGCGAGTLPSGSKPKKERDLAHHFVAAYNRHDVTGVASLLADNILYADCDYSQDKIVQFSGKSAVEAWLRARFAVGDRFSRPRILVRGWLSQPPNPAFTVSFEASRVTTAGGLPTQPVTVRVVPNLAVTKITMWQVWSSCASQTSPSA